VKGQQWDVDFETRDVTIPEYFKMIENNRFGCCYEMGAIIAQTG
jgi:hypothetical protein